MADDLKLRRASTEDLERIVTLLKENDLPYEDIEAQLDNFYVATRDDLLAAVGGMELYGQYALLRSIAVTDQFRGKGIGKEMTRKLVDVARGKAARQLYLLTTGAEEFFARHGWKKIDRDDVPDVIKATAEFSRLCPEDATCMTIEVQAG